MDLTELATAARACGKRVRDASWHVGLTSRCHVIAQDGLFLRAHLDKTGEEKTCAQALASMLKQASAVLSEALDRRIVKVEDLNEALRGE